MPNDEKISFNPEQLKLKEYINGLQKKFDGKWQIGNFEKYTKENPDPNIFNLYYPGELATFNKDAWLGKSPINYFQYRKFLDKLFVLINKRIVEADFDINEFINLKNDYKLGLGRGPLKKMSVGYSTYEFVSFEDTMKLMTYFVLFSIIFSNDTNMPVQSRIKALKVINKDVDSKKDANYSLYYTVNYANKKVKRIPILFLDDKAMGPKANHDLNLFALLLKQKYNIDLNRYSSSFANDFYQILLKYPNNALQLLHLFLLDSGSSDNNNRILDLFSKSNPSFLKKVFEPKVSFFTESDADVFTEEGKANYLSGTKTPVEEGDVIEPETLDEAKRLLGLYRLSSEAEKQKLLDQIKKLTEKELQAREEASRASKIYEMVINFSLKSEFRLFSLDYTLLFEPQTPEEYRTSCQKTIENLNELWKYKVLSLNNRKGREGQAAIPGTPEIEELKKLNDTRDKIEKFLTDQINFSLQNNP